MIYKSPRYKNEKTYKIDEFTGIDNSSSPDFAKEGSLYEGHNVWNKNYALAARPGIAATQYGEMAAYSDEIDVKKIYVANFPFDAIHGYNKLYALCQEIYLDRTLIKVFVADSVGASHHLFDIEFLGAMPKTTYEIKNILFIKDNPIIGSGIFMLIPFIKYEGSTDTEYRDVCYYEISRDYTKAEIVDPLKFYRPLIVKNGHGINPDTEKLKDTPEYFPEGPNILGGGFQAGFACDGYASDFIIPTSISESSAVEVRYYTSENHYLTFIIPANKLNSEEQQYGEKMLWVAIHRGNGRLSFMGDTSRFAPPKNKKVNGIMVFAYSDTASAAYELLSSNASPINYDERLFIPGGENRGNRIYFSGKNLPLYYCEKNSFPVGNNNYNITALSLQSKYVIAFKQKEIYRISLTESNDVDRNLLMSDNTTGIIPTPNCKTTKINDTIGCDLPSTIVNCANRLVWFHSDGAVYTLYGSNLYSEGSVYELSGEISSLLNNFTEEELRNAFAAELNGFYALGINKRLFLMDVRAGGFRYLSNFKSKSGKHGGLPWFCWDAPKDTAFVYAFVIGGKEFFIMRSSKDENFYIASPTGENDLIIKADEKRESTPEFSFTTPLFGENDAIVSSVSINAIFKNPFTIEVYDQNGSIKSFELHGSSRQKSFKIPLSYKKGKLGIKIKGSGYFTLKDISYTLTERVY